MQEILQGKIIKVVSPFQFHIQDLQTKKYLKIELQQSKNKNFQHLLSRIYHENITYSFIQKKGNKQFKQEYPKGSIYLKDQQLTSLYGEDRPKEYMSNQIKNQSVLTCFVRKIQCLKFQLINLDNLKDITFYFSELKLVRLGNAHPKDVWEKAQSYFRQEFQGEFVQLTVTGYEKYKEEVNIFGQIHRIRDKQSIRTKIITDGYGQLSKTSEKYLNNEKRQYYTKISEQAKAKNKGLWQNQKKKKSKLQVQELKYKQWQQWSKQRKSISKLRNEQDELQNIIEQLHKIGTSFSKQQYEKIKIVIDVIICLFEKQAQKRHLKFLEQVMKILCNMLNNLQTLFNQYFDNLDFIKSLNKKLISIIFYHEQIQRLLAQNRNDKINKFLGIDFDKCIKFIFKLCFLGNETFHDKLFGKKKQYNYQNFDFDNVYLEGGFSSLSQCSDYEENQSLSKKQKKQKKIISAYQRIRINSTSVLMYLFKHYPNIIQNYWEMCITSNILTKDFLGYIKKLKITSSQQKMTQQTKKQIVNLMRSNFGDHSLILLAIFQKNNKVKSNSIMCVFNMISNFQGKKLIATTQNTYIQKLLKQTKSSFVPKSFIVFSALRNALYLFLFSLYHEKNLQIIILIFKTLCQICNNCALIDKMSFQQGIGLLMSNYIVPVLQFQWSIKQLQELKTLCINFLSVLVNNNRKWPEIQQKYFESLDSNINLKLINVIKARKQTNPNYKQDKIVQQVTHYFTKLSKNYFSTIFYDIQGESIWKFLESIFLTNINLSYTQFIQQIFKGFLDQLQALSNSRHTFKSITQEELNTFLVKFIHNYCKEVTINNYLHILSVLTYIEYEVWSKKQNQYLKSFVLHCFYQFIDEKEWSSGYNFPGLETIKGNGLIRVALIKLLGYLSFCPQFQTVQITKKAVVHLISISKQYKSVNSIVKITWGLSNWAKIASFGTSVQENIIKDILEYLMAHSQSDKQKIASNCTRGIGFIVINQGSKIDLKQCRKSIIKNLSHPIIKVRTNSTKTLLNLTENLLEQQSKQLLPLLEQNMLKNNYHLQTQTIYLLKKLNNPIKGKRLLGLYVSILKNIMNYTTLEYEFSEITTINHLRFVVLSEIFNDPQQIINYKEFSKDVLISIYSYLTQNCRQQRQETERQHQLNQKQFEKTEEAQNLIFNKEKIQKYNEEKIISTQITTTGLIYKAKIEEIILVNKIKQFSEAAWSSIHQQWRTLSNIKIKGEYIHLDIQALQLSSLHEQIKYIVESQ